MVFLISWLMTIPLSVPPNRMAGRNGFLPLPVSGFGTLPVSEVLFDADAPEFDDVFVDGPAIV